MSKATINFLDTFSIEHKNDEKFYFIELQFLFEIIYIERIIANIILLLRRIILNGSLCIYSFHIVKYSSILSY